MAGTGLDADLAQFLDVNIDSIPQLEILLLLHEHRGRVWTEEEIGTRIYLTVAQVSPLVRALVARGLVVATPGTEGGYAYLESPGLREGVERVALGYRTHLIGLTRHVHAKASRPVLDFARAFDLKKDRP